MKITVTVNDGAQSGPGTQAGHVLARLMDLVAPILGNERLTGPVTVEVTAGSTTGTLTLVEDDFEDEE